MLQSVVCGVWEESSVEKCVTEVFGDVLRDFEMSRESNKCCRSVLCFEGCCRV